VATHDFDAARAERQRKVKPLTFKLGGNTFHCRSTFGLGDLIADPPEPPQFVRDGATSDAAKSFLELARGIAQYLAPDDLPAFWQLWDPDDKRDVTGLDLQQVAAWMMEQYGIRPQSPPAASSNGRATGGTSTKSPRGARGSGR